MRLCCAALLLVLVTFGCRRGGDVRQTITATRLFPTANIRLLSPVASVSADGANLLAAEETGERILVFDHLLQPKETLTLTRRLTAPRGLTADRHYIYLYDDNALYRYSRSRHDVEVWLADLKVAGIVTYAPAEVLVSDARRGLVWRKGFFGDSRVFLDAVDIASPASLAQLGEGMFAVLGAAGRVIVVNRAGIIEQRLVVGSGFGRMGSDRRSRLIFYRAGSSTVLVTDLRRREQLELDGVRRIVDMAVWADRLVVLDGTDRLVAYDLPGW